MYSFLFPSKAEERSSPQLDSPISFNSCGNNENETSKRIQIYAIPYQAPQSQYDDTLGIAGGKPQSPRQYEGPNNSIYEYPEGINSHHYGYPSADKPELKNGTFKNIDEKNNRGTTDDVETDENYTPLTRSQGDKHDNEAPGYQPLLHGERIEETGIIERKNGPDKLIYVTVVDGDHSLHGCENNDHESKKGKLDVN